MKTNIEIAAALHTIADNLEEQEDNPYRVRAYRRAANSIKRYTQNVYDLVLSDADLTIIPNVGHKLAVKIQQIVNDKDYLPTLHFPQNYPPTLTQKKRKPPLFRIYSIRHYINRIIHALNKIPTVKTITVAGDWRRNKDVIGDVDLIIITSDPKTVLQSFCHLTSVKYILKQTYCKAVVQLKTGTQVTLHTVSSASYAGKLLYFTGSTAHFRALQRRALQQNLRLSKQGVFKEDKIIPTKTETAIYKTLKLAYIPPELRENTGEIEAAEKNTLPKLIELADIKGDLHSHTNETDGSFTLEEMVHAARALGYQYLAITDHSQSLKITHGMDEKRLLQQIQQIDRLNARLSNFVILKSMEVDILEDGSLDLADEVLKQLDLTVCSIHSKFNLNLKKQTERVIRAMDNPYFSILGHPTGRLINHRPAYAINIEKILQAAKERHCFVELNAQPARLDLNDIYCKLAKEMGVKMAISSDAHTTSGFEYMILGINQARRGWLTASDVINTSSLPQLKKLLQR